MWWLQDIFEKKVIGSLFPRSSPFNWDRLGLSLWPFSAEKPRRMDKEEITVYA
jgi:hypothetical protein